MAHEEACSRFVELHNDKVAEAFVRTADLSQYDLSGFQPMHVEMEPK